MRMPWEARSSSSLFDRVLMFESEAHKVARWALESEIETGGDLYGYYSMERRPIVLVATGPGPRAQHSYSNFIQDPDYLQETFRTLARRYRLFYLGDWHSHHRFDLDEPSSSDDRKIADIARKNAWSQLSSIVVQTVVRHSRGQSAHGIVWNTFAHAIKGSHHDRERITMELIEGSSPIAEESVTRRIAVTSRREDDGMRSRADEEEAALALLREPCRQPSADQRPTVAVPNILAVLAKGIAERLPSSEIEVGDMNGDEAVLLVGDRDAQLWVRVPLRSGDCTVGINDPSRRGLHPLFVISRTDDDVGFVNELTVVVESMRAFVASARPAERTFEEFRAFYLQRGGH